jgi:small subunit ribosomal protein S20
MANHKSALKRIRTNEKARLRNRFHRQSMRTSIKAFDKALDAGDKDAAHKALTAAISSVAKTRSRGVIHRNQAARRIGRLQQRFNKAFSA